MKIKDIKPGLENITITVRVIKVDRPREVMTKYGEAKVARAEVADDTGTITLTLWRNQIDLVKPGSVIRIENAFAQEYRGRLELSIGSKGKIVTLESVED
ncbi:MAG: OB-fold nucleic acid binding domain-containing protein [Desulfurococcaceae archaeon]